MTIDEVQAFLAAEAAAFNQFATPFSEATFAERPGSRWSVADTAQHLYLSSKPVLRLVAGPRDVFAQWGEAVQKSRSYSEVAAMYRLRLEAGQKAPANLSPRPDDVPADKATRLARLTDTYLGLASQLTGWSEDELDRYQIPHPALGLISVREMLYFVGIHTRHHIAVLQAY
ncbi:DinB family protein [Fibrella sp. USSR17]